MKMKKAALIALGVTLLVSQAGEISAESTIKKYWRRAKAIVKKAFNKMEEVIKTGKLPSPEEIVKILKTKPKKGSKIAEAFNKKKKLFKRKITKPLNKKVDALLEAAETGPTSNLETAIKDNLTALKELGAKSYKKHHSKFKRLFKKIF